MRQFFPFMAATALVVSMPAMADPASMDFSASWIHVLNSDLDKGGSVSMSGWTLKGGSTWKVSPATTLGLDLRADIDDWHFDGAPAGFGGNLPWKSVNRFSASLPYGFGFGEGWRVSVSPSIELSGEEGANASKALGYGLAGIAIKPYARDKVIGFGLAAYRTIEQTKVFPFLIVDWKIAENWRISNPLQVGPSGPAGLMLSYELTPRWELGVGAAYRSYRFRLAEDNPTAKDGVGEASYVPVFAQATYRGEGGWRFDVYGGAMTAGEIKVKDTTGKEDLAQDKVKTAPAFAASFSVAF
ncbi:hypothetical protein GCM10025771_40670 [Niveibacterium umoris]|uniref:DUF6268 domain-containing protein n=1 Tax=Niveibacterium umoris TaxID=1193620 RepID=A0A840BCH5_9RHOO|nr:DUF6268 family outer membrane beta-barrel protein [Niveibacterium umoris]MBB4010730.1 hypothetical protein [Niveibacterium umoris]